MRKSISAALALAGIALGVAMGYTLATIQYDSNSVEARYENYTDRGRICLEAAAMLRSGQPGEVLKYLEGHALSSIRGVPMGRSYAELTSKSQVLMVSARRYDEEFDDVDLEIEQLTRSDIPLIHTELSETLKSVTAESEG